MTSSAPLAVLAGVVSGALVALQQRVNGDLAVSLDDAVLAAVVSFGTGLALVVVVVAVRRSARARVATLRTLPWHWRLGGLGGASLVAAGAAAAPRIGVALFTVGLVAGTTLGGLAVDVVGLGPGGHHPLTPPRLAGAGIGLLAIVASAAEGLHAADPWLLVAVVVAGCLVSYQQAVNGRVRAATDATVATLQNFVVGLTALLLGLGLHALTSGVGAASWPGADRLWLYLGGPIGATFVAVAAIVVRQLGVLRFGLAVTAGQLAGGLLLDLDRGLETATLVGAALAMAAVAVSGAGSRRRVPA
ncbi:MAG TPA: DMT family transporter [Mycobacteriales bacterium]|nr:DMT family transporter [Mycobacteriales bacterium]